MSKLVANVFRQIVRPLRQNPGKPSMLEFGEWHWLFCLEMNSLRNLTPAAMPQRIIPPRAQRATLNRLVASASDC